MEGWLQIFERLKIRFAPILRYFDAETDEARARNTIAAIVLGNIPFYPLYVAWFVGWRAWPAFLAFPSLPLFALVPAANRINARAGRWVLVFAGLVDTGLCALGLGAGSGVELFYIPVALLPLVLYREETLGWRTGMAVIIAVIFLLGRVLGGPLATYTPLEQSGLTKMNAVSVTLLCIVIFTLRWRLSGPATPAPTTS